jgi:phytoene dehydrogenase-like protein
LFARNDIAPDCNAPQRKAMVELLQKAGVKIHINTEVDLKQRRSQHSTFAKFDGKALLDGAGKELMKADLVLWFVGGKVCDCV